MAKNKKYRKTKLVIYSAILVAIVAFGFYKLAFDRSSKDGGAVVSTDGDKVTIKYKDCLVALTGFKEYQNSITLDQLKKKKVYTESEKVQELKDFGFSDVNTMEGNDVYAFYKSVKSSGFYAVVSPQDADFELKTLHIGGKNIWNKQDIASYSLCVTKETTVQKDQSDKYINENLAKIGNEYYSFDPSKINSIFIGGEVIPARAVDRNWLNLTNNYTLLFDRVKDRVQQSDLAIAMLENPISGNPTPCRGCMMFVGDEKNAEGFKTVGFDAFGIGNHFGDGQQKALTRTIQVMQSQGIGLVGASDSTLDVATKPYIMQMGKYKVAMLSADDVSAYYWFGNDWGSNYYSNKSASGGVGTVNYTKIAKDIADAKKQADYLIVMMSWGIEYTNNANQHQEDMAHAMIDAGADVIVGSHPHWVQQVEVYNEKPIFYSLGNFVFDQTGEGAGQDKSRRNGETRQGMTGQLFFYDGKLMSIDLVPHKYCGSDQVGGESYNKTRNLAWKIMDGTMTYAEADQIPESQGCVWYQPTPVGVDSSFYKAVWDRMMQYTKL